MRFLVFLIFLISCGNIKLSAEPYYFPDSNIPVDTAHIPNNGIISVKDFFAIGDGTSDDYLPIINACNYCIANPRTCSRVRFPGGVNYDAFYISRVK